MKLFNLLLLTAMASVAGFQAHATEVIRIDSKSDFIKSFTVAGDGTAYGFDSKKNIYVTRDRGANWSPFKPNLDTGYERKIVGMKVSLLGELFVWTESMSGRNEASLYSSEDLVKWKMQSAGAFNSLALSPLGEPHSIVEEVIGGGRVQVTTKVDGLYEQFTSREVSVSNDGQFCEVRYGDMNAAGAILCVSKDKRTLYSTEVYQKAAIAVDGNALYAINLNGALVELNPNQPEVAAQPLTPAGEVVRDLSVGIVGKVFVLTSQRPSRDSTSQLIFQRMVDSKGVSHAIHFVLGLDEEIVSSLPGVQGIHDYFTATRSENGQVEANSWNEFTKITLTPLDAFSYHFKSVHDGIGNDKSTTEGTLYLK